MLACGLVESVDRAVPMGREGGSYGCRWMDWMGGREEWWCGGGGIGLRVSLMVGGWALSLFDGP